MRSAWRQIFFDAQRTVASPRRSSHHSAPAPTRSDQDTPATSAHVRSVGEVESENTQDLRERLAGEAQRDTAISTSGLSPAAVSFVHGLELHTVGELLDYSQRRLVTAPGLGAKTRGEVLGRIRQWRERFAEQPVAPLTPEGRREARAELTDAERTLTDAVGAGDGAEAVDIEERALRSVSLDTLATLFVPEVRKNRSNANEAEMVRLLLRIPNEQGVLPDIGVWPVQREVAEKLGLSVGRIPQMVRSQRTRWKRLPAVAALRHEVLDLLRERGRVATAAEIADTLVVRRGTNLLRRDQRRSLGLAAVRAVVEVELLDRRNDEAFQHLVNRQAADESLAAGLLALEVGEEDPPHTPSAPALLQYAQRLGQVADRLAGFGSLPTSATVLRELERVSPPSGVVTWDERRLVELAAAASRTAAATPRLEIYPRRLPLVRALRLTQAGLVRLLPNLPDERQPGLRPEEIHERVRARFPEILDEHGGHTLPEGGLLTKALHEAGFDLVLSARQGSRTLRYLPRNTGTQTSYLTTKVRGRSVTAHGTRYAEDPDRARRAHTAERLTDAAHRDGFRVLTVRTELVAPAIEKLSTESGPFGAQPLSVTELFLAALHELVDARPKPTWETIMRADVAEPGSRAALKFAEYAQTSWGVVEPRLRARLGRDGGPLLLVDCGAFARYDAMSVLERLAEASRQGGRPLWLLCPQEDTALPPRLGTTSVPYQSGLGEWIELPDVWVVARERQAR